VFDCAARSEFNVVEASIMDMQRAMANGGVTSRELVQQYLTRIALYNKKLNAVMTVNPNALREAEERDRERRWPRAAPEVRRRAMMTATHSAPPAGSRSPLSQPISKWIVRLNNGAIS
jgi:hypothetical protein